MHGELWCLTLTLSCTAANNDDQTYPAPGGGVILSVSLGVRANGRNAFGNAT